MAVQERTWWKILQTSWVQGCIAGRVVGSTLKAQRENPEMTVRNTDPVLKGMKQRLEQLTQELLVELGWESKARKTGEEEEGGSAQTDKGSGDYCDDEDGCETSGEETSDDTSSGHSPETKVMAPPHHPIPPIQLSPPQVAAGSSAHTVTIAHLPLPVVTLLLLLLSTGDLCGLS